MQNEALCGTEIKLPNEVMGYSRLFGQVELAYIRNPETMELDTTVASSVFWEYLSGHFRLFGLTGHASVYQDITNKIFNEFAAVYKTTNKEKEALFRRFKIDYDYDGELESIITIPEGTWFVISSKNPV